MAASENEMGNKTIHIGLLIFPGVYQMDATGPYGVFAAAPGVKVHLLWKDNAPISSSDGLILTPTTSFDDCPPLDVLCVPGGGGLLSVLEDTEILAFVEQQAKTAKYVTSVCTGSLILGAIGALDGYKATTHWNAQDLLEACGVEFVRERVVIDRNRITGAGVSAGIDMALTLVGEMWGKEVAQEIELRMEYDPRPPFKSGHPSIAPKAIVDQMINNTAASQHQRLEAILKVVEKTIRLKIRIDKRVIKSNKSVNMFNCLMFVE